MISQVHGLDSEFGQIIIHLQNLICQILKTAAQTSSVARFAGNPISQSTPLRIHQKLGIILNSDQSSKFLEYLIGESVIGEYRCV